MAAVRISKHESQPQQHLLPLRMIIIVAICIILAFMGGVAGSYMYQTYQTKTYAQETGDKVSKVTHAYLNTYLNDGEEIVADAKTDVIAQPIDTQKIAQEAAALVATELINNNIRGVATDEELKVVDLKLQDMLSSYNLSEDELKTITDAVAATIKADMYVENTNNDSVKLLQTSMNAQIKALETQITEQQQLINQLQAQLANVKDGRDGIDGTNGVDGRDGRDGSNGTSGKDGRNGKDGRDGVDGVDGKDGINGSNGKDGRNGVDGKNGSSSYTHIKYAAQDPTLDPTTTLYDEPSPSTVYIGIATTNTSAAPMNSQVYTWSRYKDLSITAQQDDDGVTTLIIQ